MKRAWMGISFVVIGLSLVSRGASTAPATQAATTTATDPKLLARMAQVDEKGAAIVDLSADFEQRKLTALLRKPLISSGHVRVKGSVSLWETEKPEPNMMRTDQSEVRLYYPKQALEEVYPVDSRLGNLVANPLPRLKSLQAHFTFEAIPVSDLSENGDENEYLALRLIPKDDALSEHVQQVRVLLDVRRGMMLRMEITDPDEDRTVIVFSNVRTNSGLSDADLALHVPANVRITHPLAALEGPSIGGSR